MPGDMPGSHRRYLGLRRERESCYHMPSNTVPPIHTQLLGDHSKAVAVMTSAVEMDSSNGLLYLQLLDLHTSGPSPPDLPAAEALFQRVASSKTLSEDVKESFVLRREQLLEEFGGSISE